MRSLREQRANHDGCIADRRMRVASSGAIPIVRSIAGRQEYRSLSVCALCVDRRSKLRETLDQTQLTGDHAPMKRVVSERIASASELRTTSQHGCDFS